MQQGSKYSAFTLVELIVVMVVLTILSTLGAIHYIGYSKDSRDVVRVSDITNMRQVIEIVYIQSGDLPSPDNGVEVSHDADVVWTQGVFGSGARIEVRNLDKVPEDPSTGNNYSYSVLNNGKEYELVTMFEGDVIGYVGSIIPQAHAASRTAYTLGSYNKRFASIKNGKDITILALPSITTSDISKTTVSSIIESGDIVIHTGDNLPANFNKVLTPQTGMAEDIISNLVIYQGNTSQLGDINAQQQFLKDLQDTYKDSIVIENDSVYDTLMKLDTNNQDRVRSYMERLSEKSVGGIPLF